MPVDFKDYYEILGVPRDASDADIKKAFRALARKYHPDVAADKTTAEARFKELNEANAVLSDPEKRRKYDELGANWQQREPPPGWSRGEPGGGGAEEFRFDGTGFSDFFESIFGSRSRGFAGFGRGPGGGSFARDGEDIVGDILVTLDEVFHGATRIITLQRTDPRTGESTSQNLRVKIPAGVREGQLIRLAGKGQEGIGGGEPGHLFLRVTLAAHPEFHVQGADLYYELVLTPWEAVLGATIPIDTLDGRVALKVPPGMVAEQSLRLRGKGLPAEDGTRGHLYAVVAIQVPPHPTPEEEALWKKLAATSAFNPRNPS